MGEIGDVVWTRPGSERLALICALARRLGYEVFRLDGAKMAGKTELMKQFASSLKFPGYFGGNFDALVECLSDMEENNPAPGYLVVLDNAAALFETDGKLFETLVDCAKTAAEQLRRKSDRGARLKFVFVAPEGKASSAVGAQL